MDTSGSATDKEKRMKREIANCNERRRMQSINTGFQNLRHLLPHNDGDKLSKANILQHATELIKNIQEEKKSLINRLNQVTRILMSIKNGVPVHVAIGSLDLDAILTSTATTTATTLTTKITLEVQTEVKSTPQQNNAIVKTEPSSGLKNGLISAESTAPQQDNLAGSDEAAIALPLEVPYSFETVVTSTTMAEERQNLDTICQAIQQIEGDCVSKDSKKLKKS